MKPTWYLPASAAAATSPDTVAHARHVFKMRATAGCQRVRPARAGARLYARIMIQAQYSSAATWMATRMKMTVPRLGTSVLPGRCAGCAAAAPAASASAAAWGRACAHGQPQQPRVRHNAWWAATEDAPELCTSCARTPPLRVSQRLEHSHNWLHCSKTDQPGASTWLTPA